MSEAAPPRKPQSGDLLHVTRAASVQFIRPIVFRVIRVHDDWHTYHGWLWLDGYEIDAKGDAVARRSIYVQPAGLRWLTSAPSRPAANRQPVRRTASRF
ncbi:hypothetical protein [Micromonospora sp. RTGN7]|uniref:hypothetical protein n=1 Tax=Micromonospora sp. RTGN7 TaxID=3016526 RepID=UPI0029FEC887|nr:hypothetical protein [Micromonospora sp. RTGN7]